MSGDHDGLSSMIDQNHKKTLITSLSSIMSTEDIFLLVESMTTYIDKHFFGTEKINITGMIVVIRDMVLMVIRSTLLSIVVSVLLIGLITSLFFGRVIWELYHNTIVLSCDLKFWFNGTL